MTPGNAFVSHIIQRGTSSVKPSPGLSDKGFFSRFKRLCYAKSILDAERDTPIPPYSHEFVYRFLEVFDGLVVALPDGFCQAVLQVILQNDLADAVKRGAHRR